MGSQEEVNFNAIVSWSGDCVLLASQLQQAKPLLWE